MIKKASYILIISLSISLLLHSENRNEDHLSTLKRLIDANLPYDSLAPMDSVISWGEQISPMLEEENQMELFLPNSWSCISILYAEVLDVPLMRRAGCTKRR